MRERPVRAQLYEPNIKFGIEDRDWLIIGAVTILPFAVLFLLDTFVIPMRIRSIPFYVFTTPICLIGSVLFFRTIHIDKPGRWFEHQFQAWLEAGIHEAVNPGEVESEAWIIVADSRELPCYRRQEKTLTPVERIINSQPAPQPLMTSLITPLMTPLERVINE